MQIRFHQDGFTLVELLVVITSIAILAVTLLPGLAGTRQNSQVIGCLANQRQLAVGWIMYARDNQDVLVPNRGLGGANGLNYSGDPRLAQNLQPGGQNADWCPGNLLNPANLVPGNYPGGSKYSWWIQAGLLFPYINNISVYRCPADHSIVPRGGAPFTASALRTYSMNCWVQPMDAPGYNTTVWNGINGYNVYTKLSNMTRPGPSKTWVFIEENPYTIDDAFFALDPRETTTWYQQSGRSAWQCQCAGVCRRTFGCPSMDGQFHDHRATVITERQYGLIGQPIPTRGDLAWLHFSQHGSPIELWWRSMTIKKIYDGTA